MAFEFKFPDVGEGITEGVLVKWLVKEGDEVRADDPLAEVETDKAVVELPSPHGGKILSLKVKDGDAITVGQVIVEIETSGDDSPDTANEDSVGVVGDLSSDVTIIDEAPEPEHLAAPEAPTPAPQAAPAAPMAQVAPSPAAPAMKKKRKYDMWGMIDHVPYQGIRKTIGDHMSKSKYTAPHVTHTDELDATALKTLREEQKAQGIKVSYMALIMKAVARALKEFPHLNASLDHENNDLIVKNYWSMAFAVDTEHGLMAPVVKRVNQKTAAEITEEITALAKKAMDRALDPMDMKGGTFTISNVGSIGGLYFTPIINHPDVAILGMGRLHDAVRVRSGQITSVPVIPLSLSFDHRVVDGAYAARFTNKVLELLQKPAELLTAEDAIK